MTKFKTSDRNDQTMRVLDNVELDAVVGGGLDNCLPGRTISSARRRIPDGRSRTFSPIRPSAPITSQLQTHRRLKWTCPN